MSVWQLGLTTSTAWAPLHHTLCVVSHMLTCVNCRNAQLSAWRCTMDPLAARHDNGKDVGAIAPHTVCGVTHAYLRELPQCTTVCVALHAHLHRWPWSRIHRCLWCRTRLNSGSANRLVRCCRCNCIGGLVVEYIVAIDVTRVRFPADAHAGPSAARPVTAKDVGAIAPHIVCGVVHAYML